uniref:Polysaccharide chain length determinant N-terminal domain-containing protein n=1 Tax=candidate division WOR-3 bacterium TaxID=2052148 RepID=A0A7C2K385_UNCW3
MRKFYSVIARYFWIFFTVYLLGFLVAIILFFALPRKYKATAEIMPSLEPELMTTIGSSLANLNPLLGLMVSPADIYARIIQSRAVLYPVIDSLNLKQRFKTKSYVKTYRKLLKAIEIKSYTEGIVEVSYEDKDRQFATQLVNLVVRELDRFNKQTVMTKGKALREFLERRLKEEEVIIAGLRDSLEKFQKKYGTVFPEEEYKQWVSSYFDIYKGYLLSKAECDFLSEIYSPGNPILSLKLNELQVYEKQLKDFANETTPDSQPSKTPRILNFPLRTVPELAKVYLDLLVKITAHEEVYKFLFTKYEEAKILEKKDTPTFTVMRWAEVPDYKSYPRGTILVLFFFFVSTLVNILIFILGEFKEEGLLNKFL